jgi:hypothetical protein
MKKNVVFIFYIVAGIILGSLIAALCVNVSWLSWLAFGINVGFGGENPAVLDLAVLRIAFGINISITISHVITIAAALFLHRRNRR